MNMLSGCPAPPLDYDVDGWAATGAIRIRTGWFGFAIIEEQIEDRFSSRSWRRTSRPFLLHTLELMRRA